MATKFSFKSSPVKSNSQPMAMWPGGPSLSLKFTIEDIHKLLDERRWESLAAIVLLVSLFSVGLSQQQQIFPTVNNWEYVPGSISVDSLKISSSLTVEGQEYGAYGQTVNMGGLWWFSETGWGKDFSRNYTLPYAFVFKAKFKTGTNLSRFWVGFGIQGPFGYYGELGAAIVDLNDSGWQRITINLDRTRKESGAKSFSWFSWILQPSRLDSGYVGGEFVVDTLMGVDSLGNIVEVYDNFKGPIATGVDGINETKQVPSGFILNQNYPNPFNPSTKISYSISNMEEKVYLSIFDMLGREVAVLVNSTQNAGTYEVTFSAPKLASGTYFYRLAAGNNVVTKKMMLVK